MVASAPKKLLTAQKLAPGLAARAQEAVKPLLANLVHVLETVGDVAAESRILEVFANNAGAVLLATSEETGAVMMRLRF